MPAILEDPSSHNPPPQAHVQAAGSLTARHTTLPKASGAGMTLYPITGGPSSVPKDLIKFLHAEFSAEIERGSTYPMEQPMELEQFAQYWFGTFCVLAILDEEGVEGLQEGRDWARVCLGTFYIKPNYPGKFPSRVPRWRRSSDDANSIRPLLAHLQCRLHYHRCFAWQGRRIGNGRGVPRVCA